MNFELLAWMRDRHLEQRGRFAPGSPGWLREHALFVSYARVVGVGNAVV